MRNPFVSMALAAAALAASMRSNAINAFHAGQFDKDYSPTYGRKTGMTAARVKRAAIKAKNRAKHRAHMKGRA